MSILALTSDTLIGTPAAGNVEYNGQFFGTDSNNARAQIQRIAQGTSVASTSGTSIDFTNLPSWIKRVTVMFSGFSTSGTSNPIIQLGTGSTTFTTSGYLGAATSTAVATTNFSSGALIGPNNAAANVYYGSVIITNITGNTWIFQGAFGRSDSANASYMGGQIALSAALTAVRITTAGGTDTFDAGSINILYEG